MKKEDIQNEIKRMFPQLLKENLMSFSNQVVPQHRHNSVDSPKINSFDINTSNPQGFIFQTPTQGQILLGLSQNSTTPAFGVIYTEDPPTIDFGVATFKSITLSSGGTAPGDGIYLSTSLSGVVQSASVLTNTLQFYVAAGDFALQLPNTTRPAPVEGMIAFEAGIFYACEVSGVWKQIVTV